jgi:hypothetical protein
MIVWLLLATSALATIVGLRRRIWWFLVVAAALSLPVAAVAQGSYGALLLCPLVQLALAIALRWRLGPPGWMGLLAIAAATWFVGAASPLLLHWPDRVYVVLLLGLVAGFAALAIPPHPRIEGGSERNS